MEIFSLSGLDRLKAKLMFAYFSLFLSDDIFINIDLFQSDLFAGEFSSDEMEKRKPKRERELNSM